MAVPPFPAKGTFVIDTTTIGDRPYAMVACKRCGHYAYHIRATVGSRIGDAFRFADLGAINIQVAAHRCPDVVDAAAQEYGEMK